ncbi:hypothetical protein L596_002128 [Steinernema carpocapsae]|uniref:Globin family profile domain-containing protein n=1 Tax=Steinernema carpocapsae TaxID=34508 RepID=A0A4V6I7L5_STECR|nr:hypothetical protein L596_002128 [Steinernema carpocapsae]
MSFTRGILLSSPTSSAASTTNSSAASSTPQGCLHMIQNVMSGLVRPSMQLCVPRTSRSLSPVPPRPGSNMLTRTASDRSHLQRTNSNSVGHSKTIPLAPTLAPSQVQSIRRSWKHINTKGLTNVVKGCFQKLERGNAAVAGIFQSRSMLQINPASVQSIMDHTKFMLNLLDRIVEGESGVDSELRKLGAAHVKLAEEYGLRIQELELFGEILVDAFTKLEGIRQSKETSKAWRILIASIIDNIRVGFDTELRLHRRKSSISAMARNSDRRRSMPSPRKISLSVASSCGINRKLSQI